MFDFRKRFSKILLAASVLLSTGISGLILSETAKALVWRWSCWSTTYVANRFAMPRNFPRAAGDWNDGYLQQNGFIQVPVRVGAVVVMERSFPGSDRIFGHVGIVNRVLPDGRIEVRGANQSVGSPIFWEAGCANVRNTFFATSVFGRSDISFWHRGVIRFWRR